jgi:hypothetical protein
VSPAVRVTPLGRAAVRITDSSFPPGEGRWVEVGFDYEMGGLQVQIYTDEDARDWRDYGQP